VFTGLIEELGVIEHVERREAGAVFRIGASLITADIAEGDSIAVNGVCLTALDVGKDGFSADVSPETLARTTLDRLDVGKRVNLERALVATQRLGGHIVQGHVDAKGRFLAARDEGDFRTVTIGFDADFAKYLVFKGSVAVEGISLTVAALREAEFDIAVIPKTWEMTDLSTLAAGDAVNLEADVIAKYVERMLSLRGFE